MTDRAVPKTPKVGFIVISAIPVCAAFFEIALRVALGFGTPLLNGKESVISAIQIAGNQQSVGSPAATGHSRGRRILVLANTWAELDKEQTLGTQLHRALRDSGRPMEVMNAAARGSQISGQLGYLQEFGTCDCRWVVLYIGASDLLYSEAERDVLASTGERPLLAITEAWSRYVKPRVFGVPASATTRKLPTQEQFFDNMDNLLRALALIRNAGARPVILHTPERTEVVAGAKVDNTYAQWRDSFLDIVTQEQVPIINLVELWRRDPAATSYFKDHVHLSAAGNASVARHLAEFLLSADHRHPRPGGHDVIVERTRVTRPSEESGDQSEKTATGRFLVSEGRVTRAVPSTSSFTLSHTLCPTVSPLCPFQTSIPLNVPNGCVGVSPFYPPGGRPVLSGWPADCQSADTPELQRSAAQPANELAARMDP